MFISDEFGDGEFLLLIGRLGRERWVGALRRRYSPVDAGLRKVFGVCIDLAQTSSLSSSEVHLGCERVAGKLLLCELHFFEPWLSIDGSD